MSTAASDPTPARRPLSILERERSEEIAQAHFVDRAGPSFRTILEDVIAAYNVPLDELIVDDPQGYRDLVWAFYRENPEEILDALEQDDLQQIAVHFALADSDAQIGAIVRKAATAYISARLAKAYEAKLNVWRMRKPTHEEQDDYDRECDRNGLEL